MPAVPILLELMTASHNYQVLFHYSDAFTDPNAVLDGNFNVRGVNGLRVVDASSWGIVPGYFITTPIYMVS